ncbi:helix-turn-helix transcriptional regulator [Fusobacterium animalis]|uniref:helix-turn-helix domain-containing protein n=1 Tax=Fusobacterium animalis TaxID=76859 RepID=UPI0030D1D112
MDLGAKLKKLRNDKCLTMEELSEIFNKNYNANISKSMISRWENNKRIISTQNANIYSKYFNVSLDYIFNDLNIIETISNLEEKQKLNKYNTKKLGKILSPSSDIYYQDFNENILELVKFSEIGISQTREIIDLLCKKQKINFKDIIYIVGIENKSIVDVYTNLNDLLKIAKYFGIMPYFKISVDFSNKIEILEKQKVLVSKTNHLTINELDLIENMIENLIEIKKKK